MRPRKAAAAVVTISLHGLLSNGTGSVASYTILRIGDNYYFINDVDASLASDPVILDSFLFTLGLSK